MRILIEKLKYYWNNFFSIPIIAKLIEWAKNTVLPGFDGVPLYNSLVFVYDEAMKDDIMMRSRAISFSFFIALIPAIIFLLTLVPYLPFTDFYIDTWKNSLSGFLPLQVENYIFNLMDTLGKKTHFSSQLISLILMLYFSSNGVSSILLSFYKSYKSTYRQRNYFQHKLMSLQITFLLFMFMVISSAFVIVGNLWLEKLLDYLNLDFVSRFLIYIIKWVLVTMVIYFIVALLYKFGPAMKKRIKFISPGAGVATFLAIISSLGFSYYVNNFNSYNQIYGSLGAIIVTMIWIQLNSLALIIGYELNASIAVNRDLDNVRMR
ncbi:MAG: YihY/virulence factor BrkB family protein [Deltaproteobacteria bacterium]